MEFTQLLHLALFGFLVILLSRKMPVFAIKQPITLSMIFAAITLFGFAAIKQLPVELMPNIAYGNVTIFTDVRGGMPPPEVERLVTKPIEESMGTVAYLRNLISSSKKNRSIVTIEFEPGINMDVAALEVREKFLRVKNKLPKEIEKPIIARYEESDAPIQITALTSEKHTPEQLRYLVDTQLKEKLLRVDGVANVEIGGGRERKIVINIDRDRLAAVGLPIKKIVSVLEQNNLNLKTGDVQGTSTLRFGIRTLGAFRSLEDIRSMTLAVDKNRGRVRLRDIADVDDSYLESESFSRLNAKAAVTVYVQKESSANTVLVAGKVQDVFKEFKKYLPEGADMVTISNQRKSILSAIASVRMTLLYGVALVVLVLPLFLSKTRFTRFLSLALLAVLVLNILLFYFLKKPLNDSAWIVAVIFACVLFLALKRPDIRTAFVVALSIPASVMLTLAFMFFEGVSINVMSLSGLILGIGLLVDNAVVVIENYDRLAGNIPTEAHGRKPLQQAMLQAAQEMVSPMVGGTLTTVVVFLPFSLLQKQAQILFAGISFAVTASLFSSLFVALTLVPALGSLIDPRKIQHTKWDEKIKNIYSRMAADFKPAFMTLVAKINHLQKKQAAMILMIIFVLLVVMLRYVFGVSWVPGLYFLLTIALVGTGLCMVPQYTDKLAWSLARKKTIFASVGAVFVCAFLVFLFILPKDFMAASERSEFIVFVELDTGVRLDISNNIVEEVEKAVRDYQPTKNAIKNISSKIEGWSSKIYVTLKDVSQRSLTTQQVIDKLRPEVDKLMEKYEKDYKAFSYFSEPRSGKEIFVEIFGYEYDLMAKLAMEIGNRMGKYPGFSDVKIRYRPGRPQLSVVIDSARVSLLGLDAKEVSEALHAQMRGLRATKFYDKSEEIEAVVRIHPDQRKTVEQMKNLLLTLPSGEQVPVQHVAKIVGDLSPSEIWHRNKARMIQASANLGSTSLQDAAKAVKKMLRKVSFPPEYYADIAGQYEDMMAANRDFWKALLLTLFLVFMVMACQFESLSQPFVIMGTVVLSAIGAVSALCLSGATITLGVSIGLLMLGGMVVNNGIMMIDRIKTKLEIGNSKLENTNAFNFQLPISNFSQYSSIIIDAASQRIRPIFMTTITTALGLVPMALDRSDSAVLWSPLALTVIGGLLSATVLTLFIVPSSYILLTQTLSSLSAKIHSRIK